MSIRHAFVLVSSLSLMLLSAAITAQNYPARPIRLVTSGAGGGSDFTARIVAQGITAPLGQPVIVDNRSNISAIDIVMRAPPNGYTLLFAASTFINGPLLREMFYHPLQDFAAVALATIAPTIVVVNPSVPAHSIKELIALAKAKPGALNYASTGVGSSTHITTELFNTMAGINIVHVPYKSTGPAFTDLMGGQVQLMFPTATSVTPLVKSGKLRALAVTSALPSALFPGLPTVAASGLPGYESVSMNGVFAPANTPAAIVNRLNREIVQALSKPEVKEQFLNTGSEVVASSPTEFTAKIKAEMARLSKVIKEANIQAQ